MVCTSLSNNKIAHFTHAQAHTHTYVDTHDFYEASGKHLAAAVTEMEARTKKTSCIGKN